MVSIRFHVVLRTFYFWHINGFHTLFVIHYGRLHVFRSEESGWGAEFQSVSCKIHVCYAQICPAPNVVFVSHCRGALVCYCVVADWAMTVTTATCECREGLMKCAGQCSCRHRREWRNGGLRSMQYCLHAFNIAATNTVWQAPQRGDTHMIPRQGSVYLQFLCLCFIGHTARVHNKLKPCHIPVKKRRPAKKGDHIRPTYFTHEQ